jgi:tetratricopeptide (TPR) repeat protein
VPGYTRHQLKQDRFAETAAETVGWAVEHRNKIIVAAVAVTAAVVLVIAAWFYFDRRDSEASVELGKAIRTYEAPLRPANAPAQADFQSFTSAAERATAAQKEFKVVADKYPHTKSSEFAQYFLGLTYRDTGDMKQAEQALKEVAGSHNKEVAALAKFALAGVYEQTNREQDAIKAYQDLIAHPTTTVPKATAQLELAAIYQTKQPADAARIYEEIKKGDPQSAAADIAGTRLASLTAQK